MKGKIGYIVFILLLFVIMYFLNSLAPRTFTWKPTYGRHDRQPFGAYVFDKILSQSWDKEYKHSYKSISRLLNDGELTDQNLLIVTEMFYSNDAEVKKLLNYISKGHQVLIAAEYFDSKLTDTLHFDTQFEYSISSYLTDNIRTSTKTLLFCSEQLNNKSYEFPSINIRSHFNIDVNDSVDVLVVAETEDKKAVMLRYPIGKGNIILTCNPKIFSNYGILDEKSNGFVWNSLGYLTGTDLIRTENYHEGTDESQSPFRFLIDNNPLSWAFYLTLFTIILFMIFTAKRRQKAIPVIKDPENRMLNFIQSIATLYLRKNNNADIVRKKYVYWADYLKQTYGLDSINQKHDPEFYSRFSAKTGTSIDSVRKLFNELDAINENTSLSDNGMMKLVNKMDNIK